MLQTLRNYLANITHGKLGEDAKNNVLKMLIDCWHQLPGSTVEATYEYKLNRIEEFIWSPPIISFVLESHGGTVMGSNRIELHHWEVDLNACTARILRQTYRQPTGSMAKNIGTMVMAKEIEGLIVNNQDADAIVTVQTPGQICSVRT